MSARITWLLAVFLVLMAVPSGWAGTITGVVKVQAAKISSAKPVKMDADPDCVNMHTTRILSERFVVDGDNNVKNAFVYIKTGLEDQSFDVPTEPAVLDQKGCVYMPHVLGMMAGQPLRILNSDGILHNVNVQPKKNKGFNRAMVASRKQMTVPGKVFAKPELMVPFKCDVHPWMVSYAAILPHPFFSVSAADGSFAIADVPPGKYTVEAWHEFFANQTLEVEVGQDARTVNFTLTPPAKK